MLACVVKFYFCTITSAVARGQTLSHEARGCVMMLAYCCDSENDALRANYCDGTGNCEALLDSGRILEEGTQVSKNKWDTLDHRRLYSMQKSFCPRVRVRVVMKGRWVRQLLKIILLLSRTWIPRYWPSSMHGKSYSKARRSHCSAVGT